MVSAFLVVLGLGVLLVLLGSGIVVRGFGVCSRGFVWCLFCLVCYWCATSDSLIG